MAPKRRKVTPVDPPSSKKVKVTTKTINPVPGLATSSASTIKTDAKLRHDPYLESEDIVESVHKRRQLSIDDIGNQGRMLVNEYIHDRMNQDHIEGIPTVEELQEPGTPSGPPLKHINKICNTLKMVADQIDQDPRIQSAVSEVPPDSSQETFFYVANNFFLDGVITWGRVAVLFHFGYKLALKALYNVPLMKAIITWVTNFIVEKVAHWIIEKGGWEKIVDFVPTPGWKKAIFIGGLAAAAAGAYVTYKALGK